MNEPKQNGITNLLKYLPIALFIGGLIVTWTTFKYTDMAQAEKLVNLQDRVFANEASNNQILVQLAQIQSDLSWIRKELDK